MKPKKWADEDSGGMAPIKKAAARAMQPIRFFVALGEDDRHPNPLAAVVGELDYLYTQQFEDAPSNHIIDSFTEITRLLHRVEDHPERFRPEQVYSQLKKLMEPVIVAWALQEMMPCDRLVDEDLYRPQLEVAAADPTPASLQNALNFRTHTPEPKRKPLVMRGQAYEAFVDVLAQCVTIFQQVENQERHRSGN